MTLDLEDRLHAYRPTLDGAIDGGLTNERVAGRRHRGPLVAAGLIALIGIGALAQAVRRESPSITSTVVPEPGLYMEPLFLLDDPAYTPVEFNAAVGEANPEERGHRLTYLTIDDGGAVRELTVDVQYPTVRLGTAESEPVTVLGHPAAAWAVDGNIVVSWLDEPQVRVDVEVPTTDIDEAVAVVDRLELGDDAAWHALVETILRVELPPEYVAWRTARWEQNSQQPVSMGRAEG